MQVNMLLSKPIIAQPGPGSIVTFNNEELKIYNFEFKSFGLSNGNKEGHFTINYNEEQEKISELLDIDDDDVSEIDSLLSLMKSEKNVIHLSLNNVITETVPLDFLMKKRPITDFNEREILSGKEDNFFKGKTPKRKKLNSLPFKESLNDSMDKAILRHDCPNTKNSFKRIKKYQEILRSPITETEQESIQEVSLVALFKRN